MRRLAISQCVLRHQSCAACLFPAWLLQLPNVLQIWLEYACIAAGGQAGGWHRADCDAASHNELRQEAIAFGCLVITSTLVELYMCSAMSHHGHSPSTVPSARDVVAVYVVSLR